MTDTDAIVRDLAKRVTELEDRIAILTLMTSYGPAIDSGSAEAVAAVWTEDGEYDVDSGVYSGHEGIKAMVASDSHQGFIAGGCGHVLEPGYVKIDGDTAVATCKSQLILNNPKAAGYTVMRVTANRWELRKDASGAWKCTRRISRVLDGRADAIALLAAGS